MAGIDIALWDIKGKLPGEPLYRLLSGAHRVLRTGVTSDSIPVLDGYVPVPEGSALGLKVNVDPVGVTRSARTSRWCG